MLKIKKEYIVNSNNKKKAVLIDIDWKIMDLANIWKK